MNQSSQSLFRESGSKTLWLDYQSRVEQLARRLAKPQRRDMLMEIRAHLLESMLNTEGSELERLQQAIERLGNPEDFIPFWVEERLVQAADPSLMVHSRWQLLRMDAARGMAGLLKSMAFGFGYMLVFYSFIMFFLKLVFPENIGLFILTNGVPFVGYADINGQTEMLGWWFLPVSLGFGLAVFWLLNLKTPRT